MVISENIIHTNVRSKTQILKTASNLKLFSNKIKKAQDEEVLTPDTVKEIAEEIKEVAEVATELAEEIADGVPAEEIREDREEENGEPGQIEVGQEESAEERRKKEREEDRREKERDARGEDDDDDDKREMREEVASLKNELKQIKRASKLEQLAGKYASLFPKSMHEAKMNEILNSKQPLDIVVAKVQEASDIITNKTMVKVASMTDSIFDLTDTSEEVNIASKL